jgi:hypothetical protein
MTNQWDSLTGCRPKSWIARQFPFVQDCQFIGYDDVR